ncbi:MAG: phosphoglycerate mutase [Frankiales bacterium]|nr:phosphoglycerate mutase [Frankiales bacterium]
MAADWPRGLMVVRHGESAGNVARDRAEAEGLERIDLSSRDVDVPLSERGRGQAEALGKALVSQPPDVVWVSPYLRAQQTAALALDAAGLSVPVVIDERLREREFGALDGLTRKGIEAQWPQEAERRQAIGKFYHRPPGGESWTDALLRVRSVMGDLRSDCSGQEVLVVAHQVVVLLCRYVLEGMTEQDVLAVDREGDVANCSITSFAAGPRGMELVAYNDVAHLEQQDEAVTAEPDVPHAPR